MSLLYAFDKRLGSLNENENQPENEADCREAALRQAGIF